MPAGRPTKYEPRFVDQARVACAELGADDKALAKLFSCSISTISNWKIEYPEFLAAIKEGKEQYDTANVEKSLLRRALGGPTVEVTREPDKDGKLRITKVVYKKRAPETVAGIFWLKNRQGHRWRDTKDVNLKGSIGFSHMSDEELDEALQDLGGDDGAE